MTRYLFNISIISLFQLLFLQNTFSQDYSNFGMDNPVRIPINLSGSFAEPRTNHFHSGIDIRTGGRIGQKVYSPNDGYVSRIKIQAFGGGKNLYITHNNGYTSVYMHLDSYYGDIGEYVKTYQYRNKTYEFDINVPLDVLSVKKGDLIAYTGNSGSSGGPHLHYEIRDTKTQEILNPLYFGLNYIDNNPPIINQIRFYPHKLNYNINTSKSKNGIRNNDTILIDGDFSLGIYAYDRSQGSTLRNGVYDYKLYVDDTLFWKFNIERFSFDISRYINACIDYNYYKDHGIRFLISKKLPNNLFPYFKAFSNNGIIAFNNNKIKKLRYELRDFSGNMTIFSFYVRNTGKEYQSKSIDETWVKELFYSEYNTYRNKDIIISVPKNSLYENSKLFYTNNNDDSFFIKINSPLHNNMTISFPLPNIDSKLLAKLVIAKKNKNNISFIGNSKNKTHIYTNTKTYGDFLLALDTIPPSIYSKSFDNNKRLKTNEKSIDFKIFDNISGIKSYNGYLNGEWVLFEYDGKNSLIRYTIDPNHLIKGENTIEIIVEDQVNNISRKSFRFIP